MQDERSMVLLVLDGNMTTWQTSLSEDAFSMLLSSIVSLARFIRSLSLGCHVEIIAAPKFIEPPIKHSNITDASSLAIPSSWIRAEEIFFSQINEVMHHDATLPAKVFSHLPTALAKCLSCKPSSINVILDINKMNREGSSRLVFFSASKEDPQQYVAWMNGILCAQRMVFPPILLFHVSNFIP